MDENETKPYPIKDTDWGGNYRDVVGVGAELIGKRLHASRLAAGIIMAVDAAKIIGMNPGSYRHAENGYRPTHEALLKAASALYQVSDDFLRNAEARTVRDHLADRLVAVLMPVLYTWEDIENDDHFDLVEENPDLEADVEQAWRERFRQMHVASGHASAAALAAAHGWNRYTTWQHLKGTRAFGRDRMIGYALAMGVRPEWAVMGEGEMLEPHRLEWQEMDRHGSPLLPATEVSSDSGPKRT